MRFFPRRCWLRILLAAFITGLAVLFSSWRTASRNGGQKYAEPFRIAGNLYYVGANDVTSFLITGPEGHVLIDGGYPGTAAMIRASIEKLGFKITDVKVLLNSHAHFDHAGGLGELQRASGAQLWISEREAETVAHGGYGDANTGMLTWLVYFFRYPAPRVDHRFRDGQRIQVGPVELTAHLTPGHTRGCTSWSFIVRDAGRDLLVVENCSTTFPEGASLVEPEAYPGFRADFEQTFKTLRALPADIWLATHAREFGRYRKFMQRSTAKNPADPFIDRAGYMQLLDRDEARFRKELDIQERSGPPKFRRLVRGGA